MLIGIGFFGTTILAVAISGTIKTWTAGEVLKSADLNTTITSLKTAIEAVPNWTKAANGTDAYYTAGNVGIGTISPNGTLVVKGSGVGTGVTFQAFNSFPSALFTVLDNSFVGIATANPAYSLDVVGDINVATNRCYRVNGAQAAGTYASDLRFKKDINRISGSLEKIAALSPSKFSWKKESFPELKNSPDSETGLIAQEVEKIFPHLITTDEKGYKHVNYGMELNMHIIQSIKELALRLRSGNDQISKLNELVRVGNDKQAANEKKLSTLEEENLQLKKKLAFLESEVKTIHELSQRDHELSERERITSLRTIQLEERLKAVENLQMAAQARK